VGACLGVGSAAIVRECARRDSASGEDVDDAASQAQLVEYRMREDVVCELEEGVRKPQSGV
jgi:hypothetical protein